MLDLRAFAANNAEGCHDATSFFVGGERFGLRGRATRFLSVDLDAVELLCDRVVEFSK